jgi:hypothetical protein
MYHLHDVFVKWNSFKEIHLSREFFIDLKSDYVWTSIPGRCSGGLGGGSTKQ